MATIGAGQTVTTRLTLATGENLDVAATGLLSVTGNNQAVRYTTAPGGSVITNNGTIESPIAAGRAIRYESTIGSVLNATINNSATGIIRSGDDAVQVAAGTIASGQLSIFNAGLIESTAGGQGLDLQGLAGTAVAVIDNTGTIAADTNDAVRISGAGSSTLTNTGGVINGGRAAAYSVNVDGVTFTDGAGGSVINQRVGAAGVGGQISGDRHGINAGVGSTILVTNGPASTITGRNGSGVGSDGNATIINNGTITGNFANIAGSDINGATPGQPNGGGPDGILDGDGDGIDVDFVLTLTNNGLIEGTGAGGTGSDGFFNTSEGIAAGGGTITNNATGTIRGLGLGILIDNSSQGNAPALTTIVNRGTIQGTQGTGIRIISTFNDSIDNFGTISGGNGIAILFGGGNNVLRIGNGSLITGASNGGAGQDVLSYANYTNGPVAVNLTSGQATGTGGVFEFEIVGGTDFADSIFGFTAAETFYGFGGADSLGGLGGNDILLGGAGGDTLNGGSGSDQLYGEADNDLMSGESENDSLFGGLGNDTQFGGAGEDYINGEDGNDTLYGEGDSDVLFGLAGQDVLFGGAGGDYLFGGAEFDALYGGDAGDLLIGGAGGDRLEGGAGGDAFWYQTTADGNDLIVDFVSGSDAFRFTGAAFGFAPGSTLAAGTTFVAGPQAAAAGAGPMFFYVTTTGLLYFDADGSGPGGAVFIAQLQGAPALSAGDFAFV